MASSPTQHDGLDAGAFQQSSPLSLRQQPHLSSTTSPPLTNDDQTYNYNFSRVVNDESASGAESAHVPEDHHQTEPAPDHDQRVFSGCSSISSFPASVKHLPRAQSQHVAPRTPSNRDALSPFALAGAGGSPRISRENLSAFRNSSSVRELQMRDEAMSETNSVVRHDKRGGSQMSSYSQRSSYSAHNSPTKRSSRSYRSSPSKSGSRLKKEFPLILLHCTLLPPNIRVRPGSIEESLMVEVLPEEYKQRWSALRNKLVDVEISSRGILIPHPREDMALLEERILESLELEKPRIRHNHFFQSEGSTTDSGFESAGPEDEAEEDGFCRVRCPDCGNYLHPEEVKRKWEVKVFAANGLMPAGAWAAAWQEMEKVDVEINVWLPEDIRHELQAKLALLEAPDLDTSQLESGDSWTTSEPFSFHDQQKHGDYRDFDNQTGAGGGVDGQFSARAEPTKPTMAPSRPKENRRVQLTRYTHELSKSWIAVSIGLLSLLVLFFALSGQGWHASGHPSPSTVVGTAHVAEVLTTTITTTSFTVSTAIVTVSDTSAGPKSSLLSQQVSRLGFGSSSDETSPERKSEEDESILPRVVAKEVEDS